MKNHEEIVRLLLEAGADVNKASTDDGFTPLHRAAMKNHEAIVRLLLKAGADAKNTTTNGISTLDSAVLGGHTVIVQLLL